MSDRTTVGLLGSTGSIGRQAVEVIQADPERFEVVSIGAGRNLEALVSQARELHPRCVAIGDSYLAKELQERVPAGTEVLAGPEGMAEAASRAEVTLNAVVGFAGLTVTLATLEAGHRLALANKESLVAGAPVVRRSWATPGAEIIPVDSEHCAIHQCLATSGALPKGPPSYWDQADHKPESRSKDQGERHRVVAGRAVASLVLTSSGGPFRGRRLEDLAAITVKDALAHPTWSMGPKISVDSSTLMNKGIEVLEAHELFGVAIGDIDVVVHPQSIVHSMVEFVDGAVLGQLSHPDMRLPIGYSLSWPERLTVPFGAIDWTKGLTLRFESPDREVFRCLDLAYQAGKMGGAAPAWLSAANEVAVAAFLSERIAWLSIAEVVEETMAACDPTEPANLEEVLAADAAARRIAESIVALKGSGG
ncbi:MAG: 1-deoxy-D-xylulose-5-phosphate reductoisomerase [Actinobacteria bacterium]|nr:1-deoxy-D-xylulose-5-phosphate reductoisomerase [Actinomycetota bacterium]